MVVGGKQMESRIEISNVGGQEQHVGEKKETRRPLGQWGEEKIFSSRQTGVHMVQGTIL